MTGCWIWLIDANKRTPRFKFNGRELSARKFAFGALLGAFDERMDLVDKCGTAGCCNPLHCGSRTPKYILPGTPEHRVQQREWYRANKHRAKRYAIKRKYGITPEQYNEMRKAQSEKCAICAVTFRGNNGKASCHVDHSHATGRVRALLCMRCNVAIGFLRDSPELARAVANYLSNHDDREGAA